MRPTSVLFLLSLSCSSAEEATAAARKHVKTIFPDAALQGVTCQDFDSDKDGYVSCTVGIKEANGESKAISLECAKMFSLNDGCRAPKMTVRPW